MKRWVLVDDVITKRAISETEVLPAETKEDAIRLACEQWNAMTRHDQRERDAFYIGFAEYNEADEVADLETMTDLVDIMKKEES